MPLSRVPAARIVRMAVPGISDINIIFLGASFTPALMATERRRDPAQYLATPVPLQSVV
jgi:hypothetical protein